MQQRYNMHIGLSATQILFAFLYYCPSTLASIICDPHFHPPPSLANMFFATSF